MKQKVDARLEGGRVELATSRYQAADLIIGSGLLPVRITLGPPRLRLGYQLAGQIRLLAPERSIFHIEDEDRFEQAYRAQLDSVGVKAIGDAIVELSDLHGGAGLVLLCFEDVLSHGELACHRRSFARWWHQQTEQSVRELGSDVHLAGEVTARRR